MAHKKRMGTSSYGRSSIAVYSGKSSFAHQGKSKNDWINYGNVWQQPLSNGIIVVTDPLPFFDTVHLNIYNGVGTRNEKLKTHGFAHGFEHMMFQGTKDRLTHYQVSYDVAKRGHNFNA